MNNIMTLHQLYKAYRASGAYVLLMLLLLLPLAATAQTIKIGGNIYGGGNAGKLTGNTSVTVRAGDLNNVFGGARMADVDGSAFVNIDGEHASNYIIINKVYGGNDIAGIVGGTDDASAKYLPFNGYVAVASGTTLTKDNKYYTSNKGDGEFTSNGTEVANGTNYFEKNLRLTLARENGINDKWDASVRVSTKTESDGTEAADAQKIYIGQLFGGGNGDYDYEHEKILDDNGVPTNEDNPYYNKVKPELDRAYLEICGGSIVYAYGGGNNATVTDSTVICVDNPSKVVGGIYVKDGVVVDERTSGATNLLTEDRFKEMGINTGFSYPSSDAFQIGRFFGGNNKAPMAIMPKWNLKSGKIRNVYSGGNEGPMTSPTGILLHIGATSTIVIDNLYGGCRKADVKPMNENILVDHVSNLPGYNFPKDFAARLVIDGGDINNVYGGNDVAGKVYFGNAVGIRTSIRGDVYGGGNGSYPYTDCSYLKNDDIYSDLYYNPIEVLGLKDDGDQPKTTFTSLESVEALNAFRPNAEQVSVRVVGKKDGDKIIPTIIKGSIYVGGNSATLKNSSKDATVELKIGSYVIADKVFLGNNGANMVATANETDALRLFKRSVESDGTLVAEDGIAGTDKKPFNSMDLTNKDIFDKYMEGCALDIQPSVVFDNTQKGDAANYEAYSSYFGSFFCGGNVGSISKEGRDSINFNHEVIIYDKLVGGCNNAIVPKTDYNASYEGGIIGDPDESGNKLLLNLSGLKIEPKRWNDAHTELVWNTVDSREYDTDTKTYKQMAAVTSGDGGTSTADDLARRLYGGNIYGGCYSSGIVNGNVVINLNATLVEREKLFDEAQTDELGEEESLYGSDQATETTFTITKRNTGVILGQQGMDVLGSALNVFGGGKGKDTEIWGSTVINLNKGYVFQIFGGSEEGVIGKPVGSTTNNDYVYDASSGEYSYNGKIYKKDTKYSCYVNLCGTKAGVSKAADQSEDMAECEFMYGGGFFGPIAGNTVINLGNGRIFNSFAGSCNGDILGTAETFMGRQVKDQYKVATPANVIGQDRFEPGFPWVRDIVYGANDLGGRILGENNYANHVRGERDWDKNYTTDFNVYSKVHSKDSDNDGTPDVFTAGAYVEYLQGRADAIFGGHYGTYDYSDRKFSRYTDNEGEPLIFAESTDPKFYKPRVNNAFVNFRPTYYNANNVVKQVFGGSQGMSGEKERDLLQNRSYVLIDIPQIAETTGTADSSEETVNFNKFSNMEVFGAGAWSGLGMKYTYSETTGVDEQGNPTFDLDQASAIIDLVRGEIGAAYGGSLSEGVTRRTVVNVPKGSTIKIGSIFGGAYGMETYKPCDVYEAHVEYHSEDACLVNNRPRIENNTQLGNPLMLGAIYGGNNNQRRTLYGKINIDVPVRQSHYKYGMTTGTVYGAGYGSRTWNEYTEINLNDGAEVYEVYGGGEAGGVMGAESISKYYQLNPYDIESEEWKAAWTLGGSGYDAADFKEYHNNIPTNLDNPLVRKAEIDDRTTKTYKYNTNVIVNEGAYVGNYAYAGGYGSEEDRFAGSGDVYGTTYVALLGGTVKKDIYAAGTLGAVYDLFGVGAYNSETNTKGFTASTTAYIKGGTVRNVYGGGWRGSVGHHAGSISNVANNSTDQDGEAHVIIGDPDGSNHLSGIPSITRNVYGGGEGGAIYGDAYVTLNKGYIGYRYNGTLSDDALTTDIDERYVAELDDASPGDNLLEKGGNVFGGGYVANSYVDRAHVTMWGGTVRGGLYGGGEIGPIGRGTVHADTLKLAKVADYLTHNHTGSAQPAAIYKGGSTEVFLYDGHVMRDVFGGGRGYDNWGGEGFFQSNEEKEKMDRSSKGYVFGSTAVHIYGGEIGTTEGVLQGYGNVFGGGNEGFVYSATGQKVGTDSSDQHLTDGVPTDGGGFYYTGGDKTKGLTLDCYVEVAPKARVTDADGITIGTTDYAKGDYVPVEALNQLKNRNNEGSKWEKLDTRGIIIHNALFAGGNITEGSDKLFANTTTVYGNAAASLRDVYNFDLITLGTEDMGGLYGDGNLTLVDGFRELHIDNYGTDYYSLNETMPLTDYYKLTERQQAYYKLKYVSNSDHPYTYYESKSLHVNDENGETYKKGQKITPATYATFTTTNEQGYWAEGSKTFQKDDQIEEGEYILMDSEEQALWTLFGVTSIYAGRPMNTIQRADMCGVFGSRMVLKGAQDRVPEAVDYTNYTINRVDEVSLNKRKTQAGDSGIDEVHGNYFGIYNVVNYLGNLTSDVFFTENDEAADGDAIRKTDPKENANKGNTKQTNTPYGEATYYQWKAEAPHAKNRNNGQSHNKVALASGVYLEIKREEGETTGTTDWGYITGVIELDLINVMPGMGGGYVYARNEHGTKTWHPEYDKVTMLNENNAARTYRRFTYTDNGTSNVAIETSGNFVHNTKQIIDDCYPNGGLYKDHYVQSPAHYWFIRGQIYVYDQYISAFTGSANAYAEKVEMPLTISAAANGRMTLREVQPNYYAYYDKNGNKLGAEGSDERLIINNTTYHLNDPVSYWTYRLMSEADKAKFVEETYIAIDDCSVGGTSYAKGTVLTKQEYTTLKGAGTAPAVTYTDEKGVEQSDGNFEYFFRQSNNISHNTGYVLTYDINNPMVWNNYHTKITAPSQANKLNTDQYKVLTTGQSDYIEGPTYTPKAGSNGVFGQGNIKQGEIVYGKTYRDYQTMYATHGSTLTGQATVTEPAYVMTKEYSVKDENGVEVQHLNAGTPIYQSKYTSDQWTALTTGSNPAAVAAKVCTALLEFSATDYVYAGQLLTAADIATLKTKVINKNGYVTDDTSTAEEKAEIYLTPYIDDAYYCTAEGLYGGTYFEAGKAYRAIDTWCSMSATDRENFVYNYDALDLLVDPTYDGRLEDNYGFKPQYDGYAPRTTEDAIKAVEDGTGTASPQHAGSTPLNPTIYSKTQPIDYQAECTEAVSYTDENNQTVSWPANSDQSGWLTREQYEDIPNEKHHYSPIIVTKPGNYYVVNTAFMRGDIPYTVGQTIDEDSYYSMTTNQRTNIDVLAFAESHTSKNDANEYVETYYYYCREDYKVNEKGEGRKVTTLGIKEGTTATTYTSGQTVPKGVIIAKGSTDVEGSGYDYLTNKQTGFIIHGTSPTEVSTLYVSNESDINDLQKEKIITVIYLYEYEESDESGLNVSPVSERHIVNIHINFKSGVPEIGEIDPPAIVLPGTTLGLNIPTVTQGAYRVTESGWEVFENDDDAVTHYNGQEYINNETPVYWYQNNNYWIAYYAKTRLGKTYSNSVPISVANYHDLKKVMDDKLHHYYIDHKDVEREPKIYINDYSSSDENGLDLFKNLIDLSHLDNTKVNTDPETGLITTVKDTEPAEDSPFKGHALLDNTHATKPMRGGKYLEFFLRADQDHGPTTEPNPEYESDNTKPETITVNHPWTPIANNDGECFSGILHGDGHTISGLDHSFINHLCGDIYNLGVTGSFTGAGVAETGGGYVENCWISTSNTAAKTSKPIFGTPTDFADNDEPRPYRIVNCYYEEGDDAANKYSNHTGTYGIPTRKPKQAFYNGEVAYDLNGFYLWKRYCDKTASTGEDNQKYQYFTVGSDNSLTLQAAKYYTSDAKLSSSGSNGNKYVEDRFADGDFRYSDGTIPGSPDERLYSWEEEGKEKTAYYPIWPDDYLFFGQALNYGHMDGLNGRDLRTHQDYPSVINKGANRVLTSIEGNRVYRAPAYFRSKQMGVAHFNPAAVFAATKKGDATTLAYKGMTAIDFTGSNGDVAHGYKKGSDTSDPYTSITGGAFYPPLLDDGGLTDFYNADLTRNLLAYTMTGSTAAAKTNGVVSTYLKDEAYTETNSKYHTVAERDIYADDIRGHRVQLDNGSFIAKNDHMLVDRQDFNAPISYTFAAGQRMWYQRQPDNYVGKKVNGSFTDYKSGWEGVSLPFKAELVTTDVKGEITHFYSDSWTSRNTTSKIGHEYWLREYKGGGVSETDSKVFEATFDYPNANTEDGTKEYTNTFLWDYYYSYNSYKDLNSDNYQEDDDHHTYYKDAREHKNYPRLAAAVPYIIGFPGERYYEFDLSGNFEAVTAKSTPEKLAAQTITFASKPGTTIGVSDDEMGGTSADSYTFKPSYLNQTFPAGTANTYTLNASGNSYEIIPAASDDPEQPVADTKVNAFRPYFIASGSGNSKGRRYILFSQIGASYEPQSTFEEEGTGTIDIAAGRHTIIVTSSLKAEATVQIVSTTGVTLTTFTLQPGERVETPLQTDGVYIVRTEDGTHIKKLTVK